MAATCLELQIIAQGDATSASSTALKSYLDEIMNGGTTANLDSSVTPIYIEDEYGGSTTFNYKLSADCDSITTLRDRMSYIYSEINHAFGDTEIRSGIQALGIPAESAVTREEEISRALPEPPYKPRDDRLFRFGMIAFATAVIVFVVWIAFLVFGAPFSRR